MMYILYQDGHGMTGMTLKIVDDSFIRRSPGYTAGEVDEILKMEVNDVWTADHFKLIRVS